MLKDKSILYFFEIVLVVMFITLISPFEAKSVDSETRFDIFSQENGLPNNQIQSIYQDNRGWMWIGTSQGLSRFDGYNFVNFIPDANDSNSITGNLIRVITEDSRGNLYIGTESGGLNVFDRNNEKFLHPYKNHPEFKYKEVSVNDIAEDKNGNLWVGTNLNILVIDTAGNLEPLRPKIANSEKFVGNYVRRLEFDTYGKLWIGTNNGIFIYDQETNEMVKFSLPFSENQNHEIWEIYNDEDGMIWIGTYSAGAFLVDPKTRSIQSIKLDPDIERSETVRSISKGIFGDYWIGTRGGLFVYSKNKGVTGFYKHKPRELKSISNNSILSVFHDSKGETWIGTRSGLNLLAKSKQVFRNFSALPGDNNYLNSSTIYTFWIDSKDNIWIGTEDGGINIYNPNTGIYEYLMARENDKNFISQNCIKAFLDDGKDNLWVGTFLGGVDIIDLKTRNIKHFQHNSDVPGSLSDNRVMDICMDKNGEIWVATWKGVDKFVSKTNSFKHYPQFNGNEQISWIETDSNGNLWMGSLNEVIVYNIDRNEIRGRFSEHSRAMFESSKNEIWIATIDKGIAIYSATSGAVKYYNENDGLTNNQALCILEDNENNLWISTTNGLSKFNPGTEHFQNFTSKDGLSNNQFCYGAAYKTQKGELLFGSIAGFNLFNPNEIIAEDDDVPIVLTDFKIFNKSVPISDSKKSVLQKSISETSHLKLNYDQNVFTIEFAALNFVNSENNLYTYILEGFNKEWNEPGKTRTATYTNLNPGDYVLRIKRVTPGIQEVGNEYQLKITILPPIWKTNWFLTLIISFILFMIYTLVRFFINREKIKNQLVIERVNARKLHELDMLKLKFFTNISHEIRTPLTLILGPLDKMISKDLSKTEMQENLKLMQRNANNLDKLISQLLDFRKLQSGNLKLNLTEADIVSFIRNITNSFKDYAAEKQIKLSFNTLKKRLFVSFDPDKIEKILNNLLSNAFKFTEANGSITVNLSLIFDSDEDNFSTEDIEKQFIEISIKDTGKGISNTNMERIFMRFFQTDENNKNSGAGIGLALVKELVKLHKGKIFVTSKPEKGTKFTIRIPYNLAESNQTIENKQEQAVDLILPAKENEIELSEDLHEKVMLIVEDNQDVRQFIKSHFTSFYKIYEATNGEEGCKLALNTIPDIIISDIIMPNVDGYELCKRLKNDERTSHIPILLLTAMHSKEHELKGLTSGADDYITKPFDLSVLQAKVENMLSIRDSLKEKYTSTTILEPTNVILTSPDERFLKKAIDVIEANISDSDLDIESFALKVGVSRMQLYRKLHALTNMTVKEFIRHIRLKRATQLLVQRKMNISEIAYEVGFKDLSHFRKCFKREFGVNASEYMAKMGENVQQ